MIRCVASPNSSPSSSFSWSSAAAWRGSGRDASHGPAVQFRQPDKFVGQTSELDLMVQAPQGQFSRLDVAIEQNGKSYPVFALDQPTQATTRQDAADRFYVMRPIGKRAIPDAAGGPGADRRARRAAGDVRTAAGRNRDRRATSRSGSSRRRRRSLSTFHYVNLGGAEFVVYRATPADVESGVRVGDRTYPGFPGTAVGIKSDSGDARRVLRAVVRPGREDADQRLRARSRGQRRRRGPRSHAVHETVFAQHDPDRQLGRARRAADRREHAGDEAVDGARRPGADLRPHQQRSAPRATPRRSRSSRRRPRRR